MKVIKFATIGSNFIVDSFIKGASIDPRFKLEAIYSRTEERGKEFATKHGITRIFTDLSELANSPDIDAIYIASPNTCHADQAIMMIKAGKHVLCEKPVATSAKEAEAMIGAATAHSVAFMEAMKTTLLPNFISIKENLHKIGKVRRFTGQFCQYSSRYDRFKEGIITNTFDPDFKGGAMVDLGVYGLAPIVHLFGAPSHIHCSGTIFENGLNAQGTILLTYPELEAVVMYSKVSDSTLPTEIQGEEGRIIIKKLSNMVDPYLIYKDGRVEDISTPTIEDNMFYEVQEFINLIESGKIESSINTFERSLEVLRITDYATKHETKHINK